jgi:hypothetical protein
MSHRVKLKGIGDLYIIQVTAAHCVKLPVSREKDSSRTRVGAGHILSDRPTASWCRCRCGCRRPAAGSDTHVIQVEETRRVEEYELQVSVGSGCHIGKSKLRIPKAALSPLRYENNAT